MSALASANGSLREGVEIVEQLDEFSAVLLVEREHHGVEVREAELASRLRCGASRVPARSPSTTRADALARLPDLLPQRGVGRFLEDRADLAIGHLLAVDLRADRR